MVDFPEAERPVSQIVRPFWCRWMLRSACVRDGCQVILLWRRYVSLHDWPRSGLGRYERGHCVLILRVVECYRNVECACQMGGIIL